MTANLDNPNELNLYLEAAHESLAAYEMMTPFEPDDLRNRLVDARQFVDEVEKWLRKNNFLSN